MNSASSLYERNKIFGDGMSKGFKIRFMMSAINFTQLEEREYKSSEVNSLRNYI